MGKLTKASAVFSSNSDLWGTPQKLFDELNAEFGFDLDSCALPANAKCPNFFSPEDDGLTQSWQGHTVWCNPLYSQIKAWVKKCHDEAQDPDTNVVLLIPSRTDTAYFHDYIYKKVKDIRFIRGRLHFNDGKGTAPFPSMIVVF